MSESEERWNKRPVPITVEEFDRKVEAGEDIDEHIDWSSFVDIMPGELSPQQQVKEDLGQPLPMLNISLPAWALSKLQQVAGKQGVSEEKLAELFIVQQLEQQKVPA